MVYEDITVYLDAAYEWPMNALWRYYEGAVNVMYFHSWRLFNLMLNYWSSDKIKL